MLFSCGGTSDINMALGNGNVEDDAVHVIFSLPDTLNKDSKISFKFTAEKDVTFSTSYSFSIFDVNPLTSDSYHETTLISFSSEELKTRKKENGTYGDYIVEYTFSDLNALFPKNDNNSGTGHFVFHRDDWTRREITTYSSWGYKYSYTGESVKIASIYD